MNLMKEKYKPEFMVENNYSVEEIQEAYDSGTILMGRVVKCDDNLNLQVYLGDKISGIIPYGESELGDNIKKISIISKVGKSVAVKVKDIGIHGEIKLSRRMAQEEVLGYIRNGLESGDIVDAKVINSESFGIFVDIGCGITALLPSDNISVSRVNNAMGIFKNGDKIRVIIKSIDGDKVTVTYKELLGTWQENIDYYGFKAGETVIGKARAVTEHGIFIEIAPNLSGLSEYKEGIEEGDDVTVYIKNIIPSKRKVKLSILDKADNKYDVGGYRYFIGEDVEHIGKWVYSPKESERVVEVVF